MFNLAAYVLQHAATRAGHPALEVLGQETLTYEQISARVRGMAHGFLAMGLTPGDRILMRLGNTPDFPVTYLACIFAGLVPIPTSAQLTPAEVTQITKDTRPRLIIAAPGLAVPHDRTPVLPVAELADMYALPAAEPHLADPERPAYIIYTSGTSGRPRAVVHAHRAILARRQMWDDWYGLTPDDRLMHAGAFNWTYTLGTGLMDPWSAGATALIAPEGTAAQDLPALMARHAPTIFAASPGIYRRILRQDLPPLPSLRHGLSAGEKLPQITRTAWRDATGTDIHEAYGMSECSTFLSGHPGRPAPPAMLGYAQSNRRIALIGEGGPDRPADTGTIAIHRSDPGLMLGYLDQPDETAAKFDGDWFLTGDIGARAAGGAIAYLGRSDDMMNAGGLRVSPVEVEDALTTFPDLQDVACAEVRLSDDLSLIAAFYVSADVLDEANLAQHAGKTLARYKVPRLFQRVDQLPRGTNNKLLRSKLRRDWETEHGQT